MKINVMTYIEPENVDSPRKAWKLIEILRNEGDGDASIAIGEWGEKKERVLAIRWNGSDKDDGVGNPQSRGNPTWFILPCWVSEKILDTEIITDEKMSLVRALMRK